MLERIEKLEDNQKEVVESLLKAFEDKKNTSYVSQILKNLNEESTLKEPLKKALEKIGNTPISEDKIYEISQEISKVEASRKNPEDFAEDILELEVQIVSDRLTEDELMQLRQDGCDLYDVVKLGREMMSKVTSYVETNDEGAKTYKEVESHNTLEPLKSYQVMLKIEQGAKTIQGLIQKYTRELHKYQKDMESLGGKLDSQEISIESYENLAELKKKSFEKESGKFKEELDKKTEEHKKYCFENCGLEIQDMSKWEKELLYLKIKDMVTGAYTPPMGKH